MGCGPSGADPGDLGTEPDLAGPALPAPEWSSFIQMPQLKGRWGMPIAPVPPQRRFIGFGGTLYPAGGAMKETWSLSLKDNSWTPVIDQGVPPAARYCHCTTYLPDQNEVLIVGGRNDEGPLPPAAWTFNPITRSWLAITGELPKGVIGCHAVWMANLGRAIVFGGGSQNGLDRETLAYDPVMRAFLPIAVAERPPGRMDGAAAYDPVGGRVLLYGGAVTVYPTPRHLGDLWAFDGTAWTEIMQGEHPPARRVSANGFDDARGAWILFGGTIETEDFADLWRFDVRTNSWASLSPAGAPSPRGFASAGWDAVAGGLVVMGGLDQGKVAGLADGWMLKLR